MHQFSAPLDIIVGNPFVYVPTPILEALFESAQKNRGPIPVRGNINGKAYTQTLMKYSGSWRLYINMKMLKDSPRRIGEIIEVSIDFDPSDRSQKAHPELVQALEQNKKAKEIFDGLSPSRQKEIVRYINNLKTTESVERNIKRAINFLLGQGSFVGRDNP